MTQNIAKNVEVSSNKRRNVSGCFCRDSPDSQTHHTGSQLWVSCFFQKGWKSINSVCNLLVKSRDREV